MSEKRFQSFFSHLSLAIVIMCGLFSYVSSFAPYAPYPPGNVVVAYLHKSLNKDVMRPHDDSGMRNDNYSNRPTPPPTWNVFPKAGEFVGKRDLINDWPMAARGSLTASDYLYVMCFFDPTGC